MGLFDFIKKHQDLINDIVNSYDDVYDEDGNEVLCDICGAELKFTSEGYCCPECNQKFSRKDFFNYIGADYPGPECITCDNLYPGCISCPYGYVDEDDY